MRVYPVSLRYEITKAQLIINKIPAEVKVETEPQGYNMEQHPIRIQIDNKNFFESLGLKSNKSIIMDAVELGEKATLDSMARYSTEKNLMLGPDGLSVAEIAARRSYRTITTTLEFIPEFKPEISWEDGYIDINYIIGNRRVEYTPARLEFEYIPYSVKVYVDKWSDEV